MIVDQYLLPSYCPCRGHTATNVVIPPPTPKPMLLEFNFRLALMDKKNGMQSYFAFL